MNELVKLLGLVIYLMIGGEVVNNMDIVDESVKETFHALFRLLVILSMVGISFTFKNGLPDSDKIANAIFFSLIGFIIDVKFITLEFIFGDSFEGSVIPLTFTKIFILSIITKALSSNLKYTSTILSVIASAFFHFGFPSSDNNLNNLFNAVDFGLSCCILFSSILSIAITKNISLKQLVGSIGAIIFSIAEIYPSVYLSRQKSLLEDVILWTCFVSSQVMLIFSVLYTPESTDRKKED